MTPERMRDAANILGELGNGKMANELEALADRYRWRPISEMHEDYGPCVLINIYDPGDLEIGNNLCLDWDESRWTHFSQLVPLTQEQAQKMIDEMGPNAVE